MSVSQSGTTPVRPKEIKLISHSPLYYWWPVWLFSFVLAAWTYFEDSRMAIIPKGTVVAQKDSENKPTGVYELTFKDSKGRPQSSKMLVDAEDQPEPFRMHVSENPALGVLFSVLLVITIMVTNIPLRGLWSFIVLLGFALIAVIISLIPGAWEMIFKYLQLLRIHINMAGYLVIGLLIFIAWCVSVFVFDRRSYMIFSQGQIKLCEHIGDSVEAFPSIGVTLSKQRDDLFRHWIFGGRFLGPKFGTGDLILKRSSGENREIRFMNVRGLDHYLLQIEDLLKIQQTT